MSMTTAQYGEAIRCGFIETAMGRDAEARAHSQNGATEEDLYRISEATAEAFANLAHILDQHEAEKEAEFIDIRSFVFGACFGLCMAVGLLAVACMLV
jgi:hypothetical protein